MPTLADLHDLMGTVPDRVIAEKAGVEKRDVSKYRREHGITPYGWSKAPADEPAPPASVETPSAPATQPDKARSGRKPSRIEPFRHLLGEVIDREIAEKAGVSDSAVSKYRQGLGIPAKGSAKTTPKAPKPAAKNQKPKSKAGRRPSKLNPYLDQIGKVPDQEIAEKAGVSVSNVRAYRYRHGIKLEVGNAMAKQDVEAAPAHGRPAAAPPEPLAASPIPDTPAAAAKAEADAAPRLGFAVTVEGVDVVYHVVASDIAEASLRAQVALAEQHPGARVASVRVLWPALG